jgi:cytochrome oxidase assembly protein ShyY1
MVIALGFFNQAWWAPLMVLTILAGIGLFWLALWQLWSEAKPSTFVLRTSGGVNYLPAMPQADTAEPQEVIVVSEKQRPPVG